MIEDSTCYETSMRYPTDVKLLWECTEQVYNQLKLICKYLKIRMPRNKYNDQSDKYNNYIRKRRKIYEDTKKRICSLLYLLDKLIGQLIDLERQYQLRLKLPEKYYSRLKIVRKVQKYCGYSLVCTLQMLSESQNGWPSQRLNKRQHSVNDPKQMTIWDYCVK